MDGLEGDLTGMVHLEHLPQRLDCHVGVDNGRLQVLVTQLPLDKRQNILLLLGCAVKPVGRGSVPKRIWGYVLAELLVHNRFILLAKIGRPRGLEKVTARRADEKGIRYGVLHQPAPNLIEVLLEKERSVPVKMHDPVPLILGSPDQRLVADQVNIIQPEIEQFLGSHRGAVKQAHDAQIPDSEKILLAWQRKKKFNFFLIHNVPWDVVVLLWKINNQSQVIPDEPIVPKVPKEQGNHRQNAQLSGPGVWLRHYAFLEFD